MGAESPTNPLTAASLQKHALCQGTPGRRLRIGRVWMEYIEVVIGAPQLPAIRIFRVKVHCHLEAEKSFPFGVEMAGLHWVLWIEGGSPVVEKPCPVYDYKAFNVVKGPFGRDKHLLILCETGEVRVENSNPSHLQG